MRKIFVCLLIVCQIVSYGQNSTTVGELENNIERCLDNIHPPLEIMIFLNEYLKQNVLSLQSIEGEYCMYRIFSDNMGLMPNSTHTYPSTWIYYSKKRNKYYVIYQDSKDNSMYAKNTVIIPQSLNRYTIITQYGQNDVVNPYNFSIIQENKIVLVKENYVKKYPTEDVYRQAAQQAAIEAATPKEWSGTGFALKNGYLITNYHVIDGAGSIFVQGVNGNFTTKLTATVVASDQANDIALLKITDGRFTGFGNVPYLLRTTMADVGESVFALGYPLADVMGDEIKFTDGKISSRTGVQGAVNVYQISVPIQPGNSGGPLFDQQGRIVGITTASLNKDVFNAENVNYAVKTNYILNLIDSSVGRNILPTGAPMGNVSIPQKIKNVKNFVFFISCKK